MISNIDDTTDDLAQASAPQAADTRLPPSRLSSPSEPLLTIPKKRRLAATTSAAAQGPDHESTSGAILVPDSEADKAMDSLPATQAQAPASPPIAQSPAPPPAAQVRSPRPHWSGKHRRFARAPSHVSETEDEHEEKE